jgi:hypothetical protein
MSDENVFHQCVYLFYMNGNNLQLLKMTVKGDWCCDASKVDHQLFINPSHPRDFK